LQRTKQQEPPAPTQNPFKHVLNIYVNTHVSLAFFAGDVVDVGVFLVLLDALIPLAQQDSFVRKCEYEGVGQWLSLALVCCALQAVV
jgi:hypothetical protein